MEAAVTRVKSANIYDIVNFVCENLHSNGWTSTFDYRIRNPIIFSETPLSVGEGVKTEFKKYVDYCYLLSINFTEQDEAARYQIRNGISIYFSVLLYWLLISSGVLNERKLKYCQGHFKYMIDAKTQSGKIHRAGMHAWLCHNGSVIDVTIWQQKDFFRLSHCDTQEPLILGAIPPGLQLFGFEEDKSLAKEYARQFAKDSGKSFYDWINSHKRNAELLQNIRKMEKDINLSTAGTS